MRVLPPPRSPQRVDVLRISALLAIEATMVVVLHRLGQVPALAIDLASPGRWLVAADAVDAIVAVARLMALLLSVWSLLSTLAYLLAALSGAPAALRAAARVTLPAIRWYVSRTVTVCAVTGSLTAPLPVLAQPPPPTTVEQELPPPGAVPPSTGTSERTDGTPSASADPVPTAADRRPTPEGRAPTPEDPSPAPVQHVVEPGDNLWTISAAALSAPDPDVSTVAAYWVRVVEDNRPHLRSGDPDLIHPGERIRLPPER